MQRKIRIRSERKRRKTNLYRIVVLGFLGIILAGGFLLSLPVASQNGNATNFFDALFTATSATCITGLVVFDTATHWSAFGQALILVMIQIGGLGFMTLGSMFILLFRGDTSLSNRKKIAESLNLNTYSTAASTLRHVIVGTLAFEGAGAIVLSVRLIPDFGVPGGIWRGIFLSVSAFCNAGFDLFGLGNEFASLTAYTDDLVINLTLSALIILGGLGFLVWEDLYTNRKWKKLSLFSRTVLLFTGVLLAVGAIGIFAFETGNPQTMGGLDLRSRILASFFQSVSPRTAGMNSIDLTVMTEASQVLIIFLMFIGASSGSTGGGVKVSTLAVLTAAFTSVLRGQKDVTLMKRRISTETVYRAFVLFCFPMAVILLFTFCICLKETDLSFLQALFECTSAFATVGLSLSVTPTLSIFSKALLMILMFCGRVGTLTISYALLTDRRKRKNAVRYPEGNILIG